MLTGVLILAVVTLLGVLSHRQGRFEERILKNVPLSDWFTILLLPIFLYLGWYIIIKNITNRPFVGKISLDDVDNIALTILFLVYAFVGNGIHFTSKIISRHLKAGKNSTIYKVTEMFHGKFSHYLTYLNGFFIAFMLAILEINHPFLRPLSLPYLFFISLAAIILGLSAKRAVFYTNEWFGGFNKPIFYVVSSLVIILYLLYIYFNISFLAYPVFYFVFLTFLSFSATFIIRQLFIFMRLDEKRRLRFIAKIFSF